MLVGEDDVDEDTKLLEVSSVAAQELMRSVTVVVAVDAPVKVCVTVWSAPTGRVRVKVEVLR